MMNWLRKSLAKISNTPFHPQWFALKRERQDLAAYCGELTGLVLDVGCASGKPRAYLGADATYVGLDYYDTATGWYGTRPELFGDARRLPLREASVNHILLLDVLEHVSHPERCFKELHRCLAPDGTVTIWVPFMYPVHDAPLDFHRWTSHGLNEAAQKYRFEIISNRSCGHPLETAALLTNIAVTKTVLNWVRDRNPLCLLGFLLPVLIPVVNLSTWLLSKLTRADEMMPYAYQTVWRKPAGAPQPEQSDVI